MHAKFRKERNTEGSWLKKTVKVSEESRQVSPKDNMTQENESWSDEAEE